MIASKLVLYALSPGHPEPRTKYLCRYAGWEHENLRVAACMAL